MKVRFEIDIDYPEPKYRPYKDVEECFKDVVKHGGWVKGIDNDCESYSQIQYVTNNGIDIYPFAPHYDYFPKSYEYMLKYFVWADDGTPCGVKEE